MKIIKSLIFTALIFALSVSLVFAKVGVGVGLGKIEIDEPLSPGGIYSLPSLPVLNTGDESLEYEIEVTYRSDQEERQPPVEWFSFSPKRFHLEPGESQKIDIKLTVPLEVRAGDYFAFLEAHPIREGGGVKIGVAAATKLSFSIKPKGILGAAAERLRSLIEENRQAAYIFSAVVLGAFVISAGKKYLDIKVSFRKPEEEKE